jgi:hypothetical protein
LCKKINKNYYTAAPKANYVIFAGEKPSFPIHNNNESMSPIINA